MKNLYKLNKILEIISPILDTYFNKDFEFLYANYMVKESGENSEMKIHQDWTYVDEKNDDSFAIWIPLINLNKTNGALTMIPKSHKFKLNERGPGLFCPFEPYFEMLKDNFSTPLYLKAGQAVIWNHRLAHYSPPNTSQTARIAITAIITPKNKEIIHYYKDNDSTRLTCYKVDADFFLKYKIGESPKENIFFKEDYSPKVLDKNEIICTLT